MSCVLVVGSRDGHTPIAAARVDRDPPLQAGVGPRTRAPLEGGPGVGAAGLGRATPW